MNDLLKDLKTLVEKHEEKPKPAITRWVPVCEGYADASWAELCKERGGETVTRGKSGQQVKVLAWVQVHVSFDCYHPVKDVHSRNRKRIHRSSDGFSNKASVERNQSNLHGEASL